MTRKNSGGKPWLKILGILVIIIVFFVLIDIEEVIEYIRNADWGYLAAAVVVLLVSYLVMAIRARYMLGNQPSLGYTFHATNVANMMNLVVIVPVTLIRIFLMGQNEKVSTPQATSSVTIGIAFDWIFKIIALLGAILLTFNASSVGEFLLLGGVVILIIIGLMLLLNAKSGIIVEKGSPLLARLPMINEEQAHDVIISFTDGLTSVGSPFNLVITLLFTLLAWVGGLIFYYLGMLALGIEFPPDIMLAGILFASFVVNPFSPYLPGVYQSLLVGSLYLVTRGDVNILVALSVVLHAALLAMWFILGAIGLRGLELKFSEFRRQITEGIQQMRDEASQRDTTEV